jgi:nucleoside-diphosphate-sugar epimerase
MQVLIAGCGDLGCELARRLIQNGHAVIGARRSAQTLPHGIETIQADVTDINACQVLKTLSPQILVYCVAANASTNESYQAHYVDGLRNVLNSIQQSNLQHVFFVSSTRVYGQQVDECLDETLDAIPNDFGGERLLQGEQLLKTLTCNTTVLRLSGIYGPERTRMIRLATDVTKWPVNNSWSNRIHRDDAANFIHFLIDRVIQKDTVDDCYIVTDQLPTSQYEVLLWLAHQLGVDAQSVSVPAISGGKRLSSGSMQAIGFDFQYPTYQQGYTKLLNDELS